MAAWHTTACPLPKQRPGPARADSPSDAGRPSDQDRIRTGPRRESITRPNTNLRTGKGGDVLSLVRRTATENQSKVPRRSDLGRGRRVRPAIVTVLSGIQIARIPA